MSSSPSSDVIPQQPFQSTSSWLGAVGSAAGWVWDGMRVTGSVVNDLHTSTTRNTVCTTATVTGGVLGGWGGGAIGATIGTMILPGVGTAVGSFLGGVTAGVAAGKATIVVANRVMDDMDYDVDTRSCESCGRGFRCQIYKDGNETKCFRCK